MLRKSDPNIFSQTVVNNGDESHGKKVKIHQQNKQIQVLQTDTHVSKMIGTWQ